VNKAEFISEIDAHSELGIREFNFFYNNKYSLNINNDTQLPESYLQTLQDYKIEEINYIKIFCKRHNVTVAQLSKKLMIAESTAMSYSSTPNRTPKYIKNAILLLHEKMELLDTIKSLNKAFERLNSYNLN
jgi:hypothetical protein